MARESKEKNVATKVVSGARVAILMGSKSDWSVMAHASKTLDEFSVLHDVRVLSAHRTPAAAVEFVSGLEARGVQLVIAAAGGAAHLAGVVAAHTELPVLGVPMQSPTLQGLDSLLSTVQMPAGIPVATFAIGKPGAVNAALFAVATLALSQAELKRELSAYRQRQTAEVLAVGDPRESAAE
jgi:5-(carboxyamino)imidazole ribonucleotide mutase